MHAPRAASELDLAELTGRPTVLSRVEQIAILTASERGTAIALRVEGYEHTQATLGDASMAAHVAAVQQQLRTACRPGDTVARTGAGRFLIVAPGLTTPRAVQGLVRRLLRSCDEVHVGDKTMHHVLTSGIAFFGEPDVLEDEVLRRAEVGLHQAAASGRQACFYDENLDAQVAETMRLTSALIEALAGEELYLVYQPQVCAITGRLLGVEALMRWTTEERGPISPGVFVPMAERAGLAARLTEVAVTQASRQAAAWDAIAPAEFRISVNLSGAELGDPERAKQLLALIRASGAHPSRLTFEVTESTLMRSREVAIEVMQELRDAGAHLAIDDFGTGYSSLAYLADLPVHHVKIDRKFVKDLHRAPVRSLLGSMVSMIHALDLQVVVEGVETAEQLAMVRESSAEVVQGYLTGRPGAPEIIQTELLRGPSRVATPAPVPRSGGATREQPEPLPMLPATLQRLRTARGASLHALACADPCLALAVLQLAPTAGSPRAPKTVGQALAAGAVELTRSTLLGCSTRRVFLPDEGTARLWSHSLFVACWARVLSRADRHHAVDAEQAYTAGLVHDFGRFVLLASQPVQATAVERVGWSSPSDLLELERRTLAADHTTIGALECRARGVAEPLRATVEHHHSAALTEVEDRHQPLVAIVQAADRIATLARRRPDLAEASTKDRRMAIAAVLEGRTAFDRAALAEAWDQVAADVSQRADLIGL